MIKLSVVKETYEIFVLRELKFSLDGLRQQTRAEGKLKVN